MKTELIEVLGMKAEATEQEILNKVLELVIDLRAKTGYVSMNALGRLKRDGFLKENPQMNCYELKISKPMLEHFLETGEYVKSENHTIPAGQACKNCGHNVETISVFQKNDQIMKVGETSPKMVVGKTGLACKNPDCNLAGLII